MHARPRAALAAAALAAAALGACGTTGDRADARAIVEAFGRAVQRGDGTAACALLTEDAVMALEQDEGEPCRRAVTSLKVDPAPVTRVQVYITNAKADLAGGESAFLSHVSDGWRLSAVGCTASEGKPADRPLECELEG